MQAYIFPTALYGSETCSDTVYQRNKFKMSGKRMLRKMFGTKGKEVTKYD
jgi:hypothetical protein